ncbi:MAG: DUF4126 domain-containing protein, partial [Vulcanimicrobiaceae bacterium]
MIASKQSHLMVGPQLVALVERIRKARGDEADSDRCVLDGDEFTLPFEVSARGARRNSARENRYRAVEVPALDSQQVATAYALSTSIGLRAFVTLALASLAMHFGYLHPSPQFAWLGSDGATIVLSALALLELASEKIPTVDHFMHAIH